MLVSLITGYALPAYYLSVLIFSAELGLLPAAGGIEGTVPGGGGGLNTTSLFFFTMKFDILSSKATKFGLLPCTVLPLLLS